MVTALALRAVYVVAAVCGCHEGLHATQREAVILHWGAALVEAAKTLALGVQVAVGVRSQEAVHLLHARPRV